MAIETKPYLMIKPRKGWQLVDWKELREYRDLFYFLVTRDIKVRYKQTVLGGLWAIIQPLFMMIVFSLFFGRLARLPSDGIPYLDYCVTNAAEAVAKYRALGARVEHIVPNTGIAIDCDWSNTKGKHVVTFVGSRVYADRTQVISEMEKRGVVIQGFGEGWGSGYVSFEEMIDIFQSSKINLNFSKDARNLEPQIKGRIFQVCMAGGFLLTEYVPGIEKYFELDKEVVCFRTPEEMVDKINYYLAHDEERRAIARAGWERACREYTSSHMVANVFDRIEEDLATRDKEDPPHPYKLIMPVAIRWFPAYYHFEWGRTLLEENYRGLWKDELRLSLAHYPFSLGAWYYRIISFLPLPLRSILIKLHQVLERSLGGPYSKLVSRLWE